MELTVETIVQAQRRLDSAKADACCRAGQPHRIVEMISNDLTLQQVETALRGAPAPTMATAPSGAAATSFEGFAAQAFGRMRPAAAGTAPAAPTASAPRNELDLSWPTGRPS